MALTRSTASTAYQRLEATKANSLKAPITEHPVVCPPEVSSARRAENATTCPMAIRKSVPVLCVCGGGGGGEEGVGGGV